MPFKEKKILVYFSFQKKMLLHCRFWLQHKNINFHPKKKSPKIIEAPKKHQNRENKGRQSQNLIPNEFNKFDEIFSWEDPTLIEIAF